MDKFELLGMEVTDFCKVNGIDFKWAYNDKLCSYILRFKKPGKKFNLTINEKDIYIMPFALIKTEIEHKIREFNKAA